LLYALDEVLTEDEGRAIYVKSCRAWRVMRASCQTI
jgi:hypothetical protein